MNTNSRTNRLSILLLSAMILPFTTVNAQSENDDEFGVWTTLEASKKINKKLKAGFEAEFRTMDGVDDTERYSLGARIDYKLNKESKINVGYTFIYNQKPSSTSIKEAFDEEQGLYDYNVDHAYWVYRNRFYVTFSYEYKIGRFEIDWRERVQYTRTNSTTTDETKYRWEYTPPTYEDYSKTQTTEPEFKESKNNTTLRSRINVKYDIANCKINPFASIELYTRLDKWQNCEKLRYRLGASYKINKDNSISVFYLYQDTSDDDEPKGHAIGLEYSIDL